MYQLLISIIDLKTYLSLLFVGHGKNEVQAFILYDLLGQVDQIPRTAKCEKKFPSMSIWNRSL